MVLRHDSPHVGTGRLVGLGASRFGIARQAGEAGAEVAEVRVAERRDDRGH